MSDDFKIGKVNGGAMMIVGLGQFIFGTAIFVAFVALIMTYVLGMGEWTIRLFNKMRVVDIASTALMASVFIGIAYSATIKPIGLIAQNSMKKKALFSDLVGLSEDDAHAMKYFERPTNRTTACAVISGVVAGAIALLAHDPLMDLIMNPAADILTLVIVIIGPYVLASLLGVIANKSLKKENPALYNMWESSGM